MRNLFIIWRRELGACFLSPVAYVCMVIFLALTGLTFLSELMNSRGAATTIEELLFSAVLLWMTILVTVISMRLFADEKRSGTIEILMTAPVTDEEVIVGKYAAAMTLLALTVAPVVGLVYLLPLVCPSVGPIDNGAVLGGSIILGLVASFSMALGLLISLMTRNQIIAAITCFCAIWGVFLAGWLLALSPLGRGGIADYISVTNHVNEFARGSVDTRPLVFYFSSTLFLLFTSVRVLESRKWR